MAQIVELTDANFETEVLNVPGPVLVDFTATWCAPCKQLEPVVHSIADENADRLKVGSLDIDVNVNTTMKFGVMGVPTLILFRDGKAIERVQGFMPKPRLWKKLEPHLN